MTRPRFSSLSDRSDPESDDSTGPDLYRPTDVCQDYGVTPSQNVNECQESGQSRPGIPVGTATPDDGCLIRSRFRPADGAVMSQWTIDRCR
jgi:hypothetical protein